MVSISLGIYGGVLCDIIHYVRLCKSSLFLKRPRVLYFLFSGHRMDVNGEDQPHSSCYSDCLYLVSFFVVFFLDRD